jgi:hypothetical protein
VWDYLASPGGSSHTENHQFTVYIHEDKAGAALTIPNGTFRRLRNYVKDSSEGEFGELMRLILAKLGKSGVIRNGGMPFILMLQRRYRTMQTVYARDGEIEFDIRTMTGQPRRGSEPGISQQPAWMELCEELIVHKRGNTQFQMGVHFPYDRCKKINTSEFASLIKKTFIGINPSSPNCRGNEGHCGRIHDRGTGLDVRLSALLIFVRLNCASSIVLTTMTERMCMRCLERVG